MPRPYIIQIHKHKPRSIPDFVHEVSVALYDRKGKLYIPSLRGERSETKPQSIRSKLTHYIKGINDVSPRFTHLLALLIPYKGVNINIPKWHVPHKLESHHHHSCNPEKENIKACNKNRRR